ncbi:hypothetical protein SAMN04488104_102312 [Algoriphagus faecimaris]|uniref:Uncharacterized protein n=1 Tax=Algoriphagus faecimaris TaxID=686796 RepID=A0A1G6TLY3_9BACT|nr:hypothetical protein [Algoriphagus faecimaris]SDD30061.1 hypothetical protein SAMN04488104_102312 [Algoriphagus faecimaris]
MKVSAGYFLMVLLIIANFKTVNSQTILSGKIQNLTNPSIQKGVNVLIQAQKDSEILAFDVSNGDGSFSLTIDSPLDSLWLIAKSLTIETVELRIANTSQVIEIPVEESFLELESFMLEGAKSPISQKKDTLSYDIDGFSDQNDKVLIDVLRKLPGIEVNPNGSINYKGEAIQKFYIEGLDLLEGRYNLATKNMPVDAVKSVEILENHQPVKILDGLEFSSKSSLNVRLKKKNVLIGRGYLGGGFPGIWDVKAAPMIFNDQFQSIVSLGTNNAGKELSDELTDLGNQIATSGNEVVNEWFRPAGFRMGTSQDSRFIFNKSILASVNTLKKNSKDIQVKSAIDYSREDVSNSFLIQRTYYLDEGNVEVSEAGTLDEIRDRLNLKINLTKNAETDYFYNQFDASWVNSRYRSDVIFQNQNLIQDINSPDIILSNSFRKLIKKGEKVLDFNSYAFFLSQTPRLETTPPFLGFADSLQTASESLQRVRFNSYHFNNSLSIKNMRLLGLNTTSSFGVLLKNSVLGSATYYRESLIGFPFQNNIRLREASGWALVSAERNTKKSNLKITIPVKFANLQLREVFEEMSIESPNRLFLEPTLFFSWEASPYLSFRNSAARKVTIGDLYDIYPGQIFLNYQTIQVKNAPIPIFKSNRVAFSQSFKDPLISLFANSAFSLAHIKRNVLMKNQVLESGLVQLSSFERENIEKSFSWNGDISKYFPRRKTTVAMGSAYNWIQREIAVNDVFQNLNYKQLNGYLKAVYRKTGKINFELRYDLSLVRSATPNAFDNESIISTPSFSFLLLPNQKQTAKLTFESLSISSNVVESKSTVSFLDFTYNIKFPAKRIEFSVVATNLLGQNEWARISNSSFILVEEFRTLRPRQLMLRVEYAL